MDYHTFLEQRKRSIIESGFKVPEEKINPILFDFQNYAVRKALQYGRYALLEECGLGKTFQQIEWSRLVVEHTNMPALILAPLGVSGQTIEQAKILGVELERVGSNRKSFNKIDITNYEQIENIDFEKYGSIVLDESSILKNFEGATKKKIIEAFKKTPYKLACTATPSPNDDMEICNHAEFLGHGRRSEILAMYFTHDGGETAKWRLKGHAQKMFWNFVKSWSLFIANPADIGFDGSRYVLPSLNLIERMVNAPTKGMKLFNDGHVSATNFNQELRDTMELRLNEVINIANNSEDTCLIWVKQNTEANRLKEMLPGSIEVRGNEKPEAKEEKLLAFAHGQISKLITKKKIACFGMNFQNCHKQIDASPDFSFEMTYQAIRRSYRFGQQYPVDFYMIVTDTMTNVLKAMEEKQKQFLQMKYHLTQN
jgi:hypothetical protein